MPTPVHTPAPTPQHTSLHSPTAEQAAATDAFRAGSHLVIQAGAGTGKTTTLAMLARTAQRQGRLGRYLAFNRAIARDAARTFPPEVSCGTAHALAYSTVGRRYQARMNSPRQAGWRTGAALGIDDGMSVRIGPRKVNNKALSYTVLRTVTRFCQSADSDLGAHHVPPLRGAAARRTRRPCAPLRTQGVAGPPKPRPRRRPVRTRPLPQDVGAG